MVRHDVAWYKQGVAWYLHGMAWFEVQGKCQGERHVFDSTN